MDLIKVGTEVVAVSSLAHTLLPPWDGFEDFPVFQKYYKAFIYVVGYAALNGRSTVYKRISVEKQVNGAVQNISNDLKKEP
jgi:hypothetical protein